MKIIYIKLIEDNFILRNHCKRLNNHFKRTGDQGFSYGFVEWRCYKTYTSSIQQDVDIKPLEETYYSEHD